jgi:hypothetical protein
VYGTNIKNINFPTQSTLDGVAVLFSFAVITGVQMGKMSRLG